MKAQKKQRKQIMLTPDEIKKGLKKCKEKGISFSELVGQLIMNEK